MLSGNRGEWSEIYAFFYLVGEGKVHAADANLDLLEDLQYLPILRIIREERENEQIHYCIADPVSIEDNDDRVLKCVPQSEFFENASELLRELSQTAQGDRAFPIPQTEQFMRSIFVKRIKAPSRDKSDLTMQIHDPQTGYEPVCGWSIKSELGNAPTLLNAGVTTNFTYRIKSLSPADADEINAIRSKGKIKDRINRISELSEGLSFESMSNQIFCRNLRLIDTCLPHIVAEALLLYYRGAAKTCAEAVALLEEKDPLNLGEGMYEYKFKKLLSATALGMVPSRKWNGRMDATGGYLVVREDGAVVAFHIYNLDEFEDYLLNATRFETASSSRHRFGEVFWVDDTPYINLNLQIRFSR